MCKTWQKMNSQSSDLIFDVAYSFKNQFFQYYLLQIYNINYSYIINKLYFTV